MLSQLWFFVSVAFSFIAWGIVATRYIWLQRLGILLRQQSESAMP